MSIHYTVHLACEDCNAAIRYEDEPPPWRADLPTPEARAAAEAFVRDHPDGSWLQPIPGYVVRKYGPEITRVNYGLNFSDTVYAPCPACGGRAVCVDPDASTTAVQSA